MVFMPEKISAVLVDFVIKSILKTFKRNEGLPALLFVKIVF